MRVKLAIANLSHDHVDWFFNRDEHANDVENDVELVGIYEPDHALRKRYSERYQLPSSLFFNDLNNLLTSCAPQAVAAFGPPSEHLAIVRACAPKKIHVMVEKPLAVNSEEAKEIEELAKKNSIFVLTNYETSWYASVQHARDLVDQNLLGDLTKILVNCGSQGPESTGASQEFLEILKDPQQNGAGALYDYGCYGANLALWFLAGQEPLSVSAVLHQNRPKEFKKVDDEATFIIQFPKTQAIIQASWNWPFQRKDFEVYGNRGSVQGLNATMVRQRSSQLSPAQTHELPPRPAVFTDPFSFLAAVVTEKIHLEKNDLYGLSINVAVVEILEAAKLSANEGRTVFLGKEEKN